MTTRRCHSCLDGEAGPTACATACVLHVLLHLQYTRIARTLHARRTLARRIHPGLVHAVPRCSALRSTRRDALLECALGEACWLGRPNCVARILDAGASAVGFLKSWDASPLDVAWASWANGALL